MPEPTENRWRVIWIEKVATEFADEATARIGYDADVRFASGSIVLGGVTNVLQRRVIGDDGLAWETVESVDRPAAS